MRLRWTDRAKRDLLDIGGYIARDNPAAACRWVERLRGRAREAARTPRTGRKVPELGRDDVREVFLRTYRIVYRVKADELHVLTVFEGHRLFSSIRKRENP